MESAGCVDRVYEYVFGPFALHSEMELPELQDSPGGRSASVEPLLATWIRVGELPPESPDLVTIDAWMTASANEFRLTVPEVARFVVREGREVIVAPEPGADPIDVRIYLLGSVFGALCLQNGLLPLHASAIANGGRAIAFLGESGAGKSTLAAFLARRRHCVISDDICLLGREGADELIVTPVAGWVKLWRTSLDGLGEEPEEAHRVFSAEDKFRVYLEAGAEQRPRLDCVVLLERPATGSETVSPLLEPISAATVVAGLMDFTYRPELAAAMAGQASMFQRCARIAGQVRAFRLVAPLGWERMDEVMDLIERELMPSFESGGVECGEASY